MKVQEELGILVVGFHSASVGVDSLLRELQIGIIHRSGDISATS